MNSISVPPKSLERMANIIQALQALQGQLDAIEMTLREVLNVPDDYVMRDIRQGFVPPPAPNPVVDAVDGG